MWQVYFYCSPSWAFEVEQEFRANTLVHMAPNVLVKPRLLLMDPVSELWHLVPGKILQNPGTVLLRPNQTGKVSEVDPDHWFLPLIMIFELDVDPWLWIMILDLDPWLWSLTLILDMTQSTSRHRPKRMAVWNTLCCVFLQSFECWKPKSLTYNFGEMGFYLHSD